MAIEAPGAETADLIRDCEHPPKPSAVLRVGLVGQYPALENEATAELECQIERVLNTISASLKAASSYGVYKGTPTLWLLSALSAGTERFTERAGSRGDVFHFRRPAEQPIENCEPPRDTFAVWATLLVEQSDVLIAIWTGEKGGSDDTHKVVHLAQQNMVPVVHIDPRLHSVSVTAPRIDSTPEVDEEPMEILRGIVNRILAPPDDAALHGFLEEKFPRRKWPFFDFFNLLVSDRKWEWRPNIDLHSLQECINQIQMDLLKPYFLWADTLGIYYAAQSRSASGSVYLLSWCAVACALLAIPVSKPQQLGKVFTALELVFILMILWIYMRAQRGRWHNRWLQYRSMAEQLRVLDFLVPLGRRIPEFWVRDGDSEIRWTSWYARAIVRSIKPESAPMSAAYLEKVEQNIRDVLQGQSRFYKKSAGRAHRVHERLHRGGEILFLITLLICMGHLVHSFVGKEGQISEWLIFAAAVLPAAGAAAAGILAQGEFRRLASRYEDMYRNAEQRLVDIAGAASSGDPAVLGLEAEKVAQLLLTDVQGWRVLIREHPPDLPS